VAAVKGLKAAAVRLATRRGKFKGCTKEDTLENDEKSTYRRGAEERVNKSSM
jgi:hypothetical protein